MKRLGSLVLGIFMILAVLSGCGPTQSVQNPPEKSRDAAQPDGVSIELSDDRITVDGEVVSEEETAAVYIANDIIYYEEGKDFTYGEGAEEDAHSAEEAAAHTVVHITRPGRYVLSGTLSAGQVAVDLGDDAEENPEAVVTLVLNGVNITCTVAPAVIFYNVYECGSTDVETASKDVDTSVAGANVIIADGTSNYVNGSYVARIYKPDSVELSEDGTEVSDAKKLHKYDAAFYSKMSMNIDGGEAGSGLLAIKAENEGLDSELHLTINGGEISIISGNDGINTNEDSVSVTTVNGGFLSILVTGETGEGDGIDSNGWLVINGGTVIAAACNNSADSGIDSDMGIHINGGTVMATGHMLDRVEGSGQNYAVFRFAQVQPGDKTAILKNEAGEEVMALLPQNDYSILICSSPELIAGDYTLWIDETRMAGSVMGGPGMGDGVHPAGMMRPDGQEPPELPERPAGFESLERNEDGTITMPEGTEVDPEDGIVTLPDGSTIRFDAIGHPGDGDRFPGRQNGAFAAEMATTFSVVDGGTMFSGVSAAE